MSGRPTPEQIARRIVGQTGGPVCGCIARWDGTGFWYVADCDCGNFDDRGAAAAWCEAENIYAGIVQAIEEERKT